MAIGHVLPSDAQDTRPPDAFARGRWAVVCLLMALAGISHYNRISMPIAGDERIMAQYAIAPERMGWVYSAFLITYTICMVPGGWIIDRYGARLALMAVGLGSALFVVLTGAVGLIARDAGRVFFALLIVRGLMGVVSAPLHPACARMVGQWVPPGGRSWANGLVTGAALFGIAATPLAFGSLILRFGWPGAFLASGLVTAALALAWALVASDKPRSTASSLEWVGPDGDVGPPESSTGRLVLPGGRSLILLTLSYAGIGYFQYLFFYWMNYYFQTVLELPDRTRRYYAAIPPLAMAAAMPLGGWLSDRLERARGERLGRRIVPMAGMLGGAALLALGILAKEPAWTVTWFALALGAVGAAEGPFWATAVELGGRRGGLSASLFNAGGNLGGLLAPVVTPWVGERYGWPWAVALGSLVCLFGSVLWLGVDAGKTAKPPE